MLAPSLHVSGLTRVAASHVIPKGHASEASDSAVLVARRSGGRASRGSLPPSAGGAQGSRRRSQPVARALAAGALGTTAAVAASAANRRRQLGRRKHRGARPLRATRREEATLAVDVAEGPEAPRAPDLRPEWREALRANGRLEVDETSSAWRSLLRAAGDEAAGPVRFERIGGAEGAAGGDVLLYVPDLDFSGLLAAPQFPGLAADGFELWRCFLPEGDRRTGFAELRAAVEAWAERRAAAGGGVVLLGEGFGGLLALAAGLRLGRKLRGLALVNPSTRFAPQPLSLLGRAAAGGPAAALLRGPLAGLGGGSALPFLADAPLAELGPDGLLGRAAAGVFGARAVAAAASAGTLGFRLRAWLRDGWEVLESELRRPADLAALPPVLIACSKDEERGGLVSAETEVRALKPLLEERCGAARLLVERLESTSREPLADSRLDLASLLRSSPIYKRPRDVVYDYAFPSLAEVEKGSEGVERMASVVSPVFSSWDAGAPSKRRFGLAGVPTPADLGGQPVLLVGNHQILGLDLGPLVREFLIDRGVVARGLANPNAMRRLSDDSRDNTFETFGAVPVNPRNIFKLLQKGEMTLLFPGGMKEALHGPGEEYKVLWPETTDFVRVAARFNAVVVPFGGIGVDDSVQVWGRAEEVMKRVRSAVPFLPPGRAEGSGKRRRPGGLMEVNPELARRPDFPLVAPRLGLASENSSGLGDRCYFSFGEPVDLKDLSPKDKASCAEAYGQIRSAVERELAWLLAAREKDPFRGLLRRQFYERIAALGSDGPRRVVGGPLEGGAVQSYGQRAPSFPISELPPP